MPHLIKDDELIARFRKNDKQAFEQVFLLYDKALYYYTFSKIRDKQLAEDIVSDCFLKLWVRHASFEGLPALKSFLYKTAGNAVIDHWRGLQRKGEMTRRLPLTDDIEDKETDERAKIEAEVLRELNGEIERIPGKAGTVFRMYYLQKMTTGEIAEQMSLAEQTVLNHKTYAIKLIRTSFLKKGLLFALAANWILTREGINIF
ncbi:MAG: sigma-70 family RNA polymerase sigma factor [Puia sp.]|nr:sigma-70 family RNA polymerase sigma factor [Puia sp.]